MKLLLRSMMFVSAHNPKFIKKSLTTNADALILDMEDAVPEDQKEMAREVFSEYLQNDAFRGRQIFVRTNSLDSPHFIKDIDASIHKDVLGIMPPKIQSRDDIIFLDKLLTQKENEYGIEQGHFKLAPLVETTAAVLNLSEIIKDTNRIVAIVFGGEDFLNDLEGTHGHPPIAFNTPKALIAMAARSVGISPIDTPFLDLEDEDGLRKEKKEAYELGFAGSLLINPRQIIPANECFTPNDEDISQSKAIIKAIENSRKDGAGCVMLGQSMVGPPMQRRAERIMKFMELVSESEGSK